MKGFTDIHTHILPGVDDGAQDMVEALNLVRMAYKDGTRTMILTPHYRGKYKRNTPMWLQEVFSVFKTMVALEMPQMQLYLGNEVYYEQEAPERLAEHQVLSMNDSHYCLLEFSTGSLRSQVITGVSETVRNGFTPIIAHAERYDIFRSDKGLTDEVLEMGALIQLNADSIMGKHGRKIASFCDHLLKQEKAHFIASDAHDAINRSPLLRECWWKIYKKYGTEYASQLFYDNALAVIEDRNIF